MNTNTPHGWKTLKVNTNFKEKDNHKSAAQIQRERQEELEYQRKAVEKAREARRISVLKAMEKQQKEEQKRYAEENKRKNKEAKATKKATREQYDKVSKQVDGYSF